MALRRRQVRLRHGVGGKAHRRIERMLAQRRRVLVGEIEQPVLEAAIEWIDDGKALARSARHVEDEIGAHGGTEDDTAASGLVRLDGLTVERDHHRPVVLELEREDPRVGGVDQPQPQPLAGAHREGLQDAAVDRDGVADPAVVARIHEVAEVVADLGVRQQAPVVEHPGHVAVDLDRLPLLDDQRPVQAAPDLLEAALMRVVPVGAGVGDVELVDEGLAGRDRLLRQMRHAVHGVRHAQRRASGRWSPPRAGSRP